MSGLIGENLKKSYFIFFDLSPFTADLGYENLKSWYLEKYHR